MASIKQLSDRKYKITISNGYRTDGRKICKAKTIQVPDSVPKRGVEQYVYHEAERLERLFKQGYSEDAEMTFETYARGWLERQTKYAPGTIAFYRRSLETVFPEIGAIKLNRLRPIALENLLAKLRKRTYRGKPIKEKTVQKYLTVVSAVLSDAKRNEIIEKNPARMIDLPDAERKAQEIPTMEEMQKFLSALCYEEPVFQLFYFLAISTGMRRGEICGLMWSDIDFDAQIIHVRHNAIFTNAQTVVSSDLKTAAARRDIPIPPTLLALLTSEKNGSESPFVLHMDNGGALSQTSFSNLWDMVRRRTVNDAAGLGTPARNSKMVRSLDFHVTPHQLRHTYITRLFESGLDIKEIQYLAGHTTIDMTLRVYTHYQHESRKKETAKKVCEALG